MSIVGMRYDPIKIEPPLFVEVMRQQQPEKWTNNVCKAPQDVTCAVLYTFHQINTRYGSAYLSLKTGKTIDDMYRINDKSETMEEAHRRIAEYLNVPWQ